MMTETQEENEWNSRVRSMSQYMDFFKEYGQPKTLNVKKSIKNTKKSLSVKAWIREQIKSNNTKGLLNSPILYASEFLKKSELHIWAIQEIIYNQKPDLLLSWISQYPTPINQELVMICNHINNEKREECYKILLNSWKQNQSEISLEDQLQCYSRLWIQHWMSAFPNFNQERHQWIKDHEVFKVETHFTFEAMKLMDYRVLVHALATKDKEIFNKALIWVQWDHQVMAQPDHPDFDLYNKITCYLWDETIGNDQVQSLANLCACNIFPHPQVEKDYLMAQPFNFIGNSWISRNLVSTHHKKGAEQFQCAQLLLNIKEYREDFLTKMAQPSVNYNSKILGDLNNFPMESYFVVNKFEEHSLVMGRGHSKTFAQWWEKIILRKLDEVPGIFNAIAEKSVLQMSSDHLKLADEWGKWMDKSGYSEQWLEALKVIESKTQDEVLVNSEYLNQKINNYELLVLKKEVIKKTNRPLINKKRF